MSDRAIGLLLIVVCAVMWAQTYSIRTPAFAQFEQVTSAFFPRLILILLALCSLIMLLRGPGGLSPAAGGAALARFLRERHRVVISLIMFALYVQALPVFGYVPATAVYLAAMQLYLRPRSLVGIGVVLLTSIVAAYGVAAIFVARLNVVLPQGMF